MKNLLFIYPLLLAIAFSSCSGTKNLKTQPCVKQTDKKFYRAMGEGSSIKRSMSYDKALNAAQTRVSRLITADIKGKIKDYSASIEGNASDAVKESYSSDFEQGFLTTVNQTLSNTVIHCQEAVQEKDGTYITYIGIELSKEELNEALNKQAMSISEQNDIRHDSDKFYETFNN